MKYEFEHLKNRSKNANTATLTLTNTYMLKIGHRRSIYYNLPTYKTELSD